MKTSDYIVEFLAKEHLTHGFFMIGGALGHIADSCHKAKFTLYTMHHEQAAAFAAEAQAAVTRNTGLALATSGPGATNLITGIASSYFSSLPTVFITGQVNTFESDLSGRRRQVGFQETNIVDMVKGVTKYAVRITEPESIAYHLEKGFAYAKSGRMGPILLDVPLNIQRSEIDPTKIPHFLGSKEHEQFLLENTHPVPEISVKSALDLINNSKRPIILVGQGVRRSGAEKELLKMVEETGIPVVSSLQGTDAFPNEHPLFFGFIGTYGQRYSNFAIANCDLLIALGTRLDSRQVGVVSSAFAPMAKIIHVDIDNNELGASVKEAISIHSDIGAFLRALTGRLKKGLSRGDWIKHLSGLKQKYPRVIQEIGTDEIDPVEALSMLSSHYAGSDIISVDVGSNQMWFAQGWVVKKGQTILTNGGMGPMGYALPAAIGAHLSSKGARTLAVTGDGGLQINIQELQTIVRNRIPVKILVLNNGALGMLVQFQTENFEKRLIGSMEGYDAPDFVKIAEAYGLAAKHASSKKELPSALSWLVNSPGPALLDLKIPNNFFVFPKSSYRLPIYDMQPLLDRSEYKEALKFLDNSNI